MGISVIVPTYKNTEFLEECINSIYKSGLDREYELLIGIDGCEETLNFIKNIKLNENTKVFFFLENKGPYIIKNTLSKISKYDKILFFDSDDVMTPIMMTISEEGLEKHQVIKPRYLNFKIINGQKEIKSGGNWGEGVFSIKKEIFLGLNGFEGWRVAADSDFMGRLIRNRARFWNTNEVLFYRRIHSNSLTMSDNTGFNSEIRINYARISRQKNNFGPLPFLAVGDYKELIFDKSKPLTLKSLLSDKNDNIEKKQYKEKKKLISKILNSQEIKPQLTNNNKLNYSEINKVLPKKNKSKTDFALNKIKNITNKTNPTMGRKNIR